MNEITWENRQKSHNTVYKEMTMVQESIKKQMEKAAHITRDLKFRVLNGPTWQGKNNILRLKSS